MTGLGGKMVWTMTYSYRPHFDLFFFFVNHCPDPIAGLSRFVWGHHERSAVLLDNRSWHPGRQYTDSSHELGQGKGHRKSLQKPSETNKSSFIWTPPPPPPETNKSSHSRLQLSDLCVYTWCLGVAAIKNHTPPVFSCVVWLLSGTKIPFEAWSVILSRTPNLQN